MNLIWNRERDKLQDDIAKAAKISHRKHNRALFINSDTRQVQSVLGSKYKTKGKGTDHSQLRDFPEDRDIMFCSEFTTLCLVILANRVNDRLFSAISHKIVNDQRDLQKRMEHLRSFDSLCRFPISPRTKLAKMNPSRLREKFSREGRDGRAQVLEKIEHPPEIKNLFQC